MKNEKKVFIDNSHYNEFICELAFKFIELEEFKYTLESFAIKPLYIKESEEGTKYTKEGQKLFQIYYNDIERSLNNTLKIFSK